MSDDVRSVQVRALGGATWTIAAGILSRAVGLIGSLLITYLLDPEAVGEVGAAAILVLTANQLTTVGVGNYLVVKRGEAEEGRRTTWHVTVLHLALGVLALAATIALARPLARMVHAPHAARYVAWLAIAVALERLGYVPERLLIRGLRFRRLAGIRAVAEITYTIASLALAWMGLGAMAIVFANLARSVVRAAGFIASVELSEWLERHPLERAIYRRVLRFGVRIWIGAGAEFATTRWDNLIVSYLYGPTVMGQYQIAYNLADVPAGQIGEQVAEVLLPSFAKLPKEARKDALVSSAGILAFVIFPIAIGFGAIAPTLIHAVMRDKWAAVAPMLAALCAISVLRPASWQIAAYLIANDRPGTHMRCSFAQLAMLVLALFTLGRLGPIWACVAVGCALATYGLGALWTIRRDDQLPMRRVLRRYVPALAACVPMVLAVLATRYELRALSVHGRALPLLAEIAAGVLGYVIGAYTVGRGTTREFLSLVAAARRRRSAPRTDVHEPAESSSTASTAR
jgi:PST family polysaccharide transporter